MPVTGTTLSNGIELIIHMIIDISSSPLFFFLVALIHVQKTLHMFAYIKQLLVHEKKLNKNIRFTKKFL